MGLNIKNEHVHALAREAARRTGRSQTSAIEAALTRLLADLDAVDGPDSAQRALRIAADFERRLSDDERAQLDSVLVRACSRHRRAAAVQG